MFQLILGIALSVILLFVITLLLTEVAATYPLMNRYERNIFVRFNEFLFKNAGERNKARLLLLVLSCILGLSITAYFISNPTEKYGNSQTTATPPVHVAPLPVTKTFTDSITVQGLVFIVRTKWEDGKIYCNNYIRFLDRPIWSFKDWSFYMLDNDGYLIKKISYTLNDLSFETRPEGGIMGLVGKTNDQLSLNEYHKIKKVEVVLDRKMTAKE
ncbi:MAG TPA: hypothetical protein VM368_06465 [Flavisolibacter sp.]|nr:hypothetical protein [Flavisolibacter sp.]